MLSSDGGSSDPPLLFHTFPPGQEFPNEIDRGPIHATAEREHTLPLSPVLGVIAVAGGGVLLVAEARKRGSLCRIEQTGSRRALKVRTGV